MGSGLIAGVAWEVKPYNFLLVAISKLPTESCMARTSAGKKKYTEPYRMTTKVQSTAVES